MTTNPLRTILVPTDFSECSLNAMTHAMTLAEVFHARVVVLHVMERPAYGLEVPRAGAYPDPEVTLRVAALMEEWIHRVTRQGIEVTWHIEIGLPFAEIQSAIERHHVDLVVMGTHGRTGFTHAWLGSVAERVVQRSPCPVLTVKGAPMPAEVHAAVPGQAPGSHPVAPRPVVCHLCGAASHETICDSCKIRVQAEAVAKKLRVEREGRMDSGPQGVWVGR